MAASETSPEVFPWLKTLPLAPEYHPTPAEFRDPIAYIFKIEKEASAFGICKIVPPAAAPAKKAAVLANLHASLDARGGGGGDRKFTSRQQQIGFCPRRLRPVQRPVWQSGERYTFAEFEAKAKVFERGFLKKCSRRASAPSSASASFSAMEIETMYWKATLDKPFSVEYANDMPGSAFAPIDRGAGGENLAETAWNMRAVSRARGSLLRFMKEEIPGVTSPMVYAAMLFSWFAWHVEDHDLHSLNYLHFGAGKTWYGVPRDAAVAFEEVVRVQGYNGEINPLVIFSILGEKTTVMSPEVFVRAGVPCCRLVQNAGEFVVTFPRAYHTGFSHGFNLAEAANIATPEWLSFAKDAAIRRASINYPPMVSHLQLLYDLALELCSRIPASISAEPRSSRLKDKRKGEGETVVKELFVRNVMENDDLLHSLGKGSPIVLLPKSSSDFRVGSQTRFNYGASLAPCNLRGEMSSPRSLISDDLMIDRKQEDNKVQGFYSMKGKLASLCEGSWVPLPRGSKTAYASNFKAPEDSGEGENTIDGDRLSDHRLFSCVTCGILSFDCVAVIKPSEAAAEYLMSADCSFFNDWVVNSGVTSKVFTVSNGDPITSQSNGGRAENGAPRYTGDRVQTEDQTNRLDSNDETNKPSTALGLLALNYGNSSDSDEDPVQVDHAVDNQNSNGANCSTERNQCESSSPFQNSQGDRTLPEFDSGHEPAFQKDRINRSNRQNFGSSNDLETYNSSTTNSSDLSGKLGESIKVSRTCSPDTYDAEATKFCKGVTPLKNENIPFVSICDEDSSRMHVFCLEHAVEVKEQLRKIGGVHIQLLCHPDYPRIEAKAKATAEELGINHLWNNVTFRDATKEDEEMIQAALDSEEAMHKNGDWAVKLGINLFYSANLSRSPLYSKQMPYNSVIYNAFGRSSPASSSARSDGGNRRSSRQRKFVAGKWCGKVWMSNQVHPLLLRRDPDEEEDDEEERNLDSWEVDVKPPRISSVSRGIHSTVITKKNSRKRKMGGGSGSRKSKSVIKREDKSLDNSMDDGSHEHHRRSLRGKNAARSDARLTKKGKHVESEDLGSDDSMGDGTQKQGKHIVRGKKAAYTQADDGSDDSLVGFSRLHKQILRRKREKHMRREEMVSDDSLDCDSQRVSVVVSRNNRAKPSEPEAADSDDLVDSDSHHLTRKISKSKLTKFMEREDSASDDTPGNNNRRKSSNRKAYNRSKRAKSVEMEDEEEDKEGLDEPVVNMRTRRSKPTKSAMESETILSSRRVRRGSQKLKHQNDSDLSGKEDDSDPGPSTRGRKIARKPQKSTRVPKPKPQQQTGKKKAKTEGGSNNNGVNLNFEEGEHPCDMEGCIMSFGTRQELALHKRNICPVKGCGKKFFSHKYLVQHRRVHIDDRPLRCPWKGCKMTFKWAWARTEHIRVHTGARPYICAEPGCGQTFRFVSDFSRHKRKTGHSVKKGR